MGRRGTATLRRIPRGAPQLWEQLLEGSSGGLGRVLMRLPHVRALRRALERAWNEAEGGSWGWARCTDHQETVRGLG